MSETMLPEQQYIDCLRTIRAEGKWKNTRQISQTQAFKGQMLQTCGIPGWDFHFKPKLDGFPLLSVRPFDKALPSFVGEKMWIGSGSDQAADLHKYGISYWDPWIAPAWLTDEIRATWEMPYGSFGRTYGPQWRNFRGANDESCDQLKRLFKLLRENPDDKRMRVIPWHPVESDRLVVRPCHGDVYLYHAEGELSLIVNQMSADMPIGIPSNFAMYAFFLDTLCKIFGFEMGSYTHRTMDTHYYSDQVVGIDRLCDEREARPFPRVTFDPELAEAYRVMVEEDLRDPLATTTFNPEKLPYKEWIKNRITIEGYQPQDKIPFEELPVAI